MKDDIDSLIIAREYLHKCLKDLLDPVQELTLDTLTAEEMLDSNDSQYLRRSYIRALFARIEGTIFALKESALTRGILNSCLSTEEILILQETSYDLDNRGNIRRSQKFLRTAENMRFTIKIVEKVFRYNLYVNFDDENWSNFLKAVNIRHRITHPKKIDEFQVSDSDIAIARTTTLWFNALTFRSMRGILYEFEQSQAT